MQFFCVDSSGRLLVCYFKRFPCNILQVNLVESLSKSVQSVDAKLNQQSEEITGIKLALQRLDRPQRSLPHPAPREVPVQPQVESSPVLTQNLLASLLMEQDSDRGDLCYFLNVAHMIDKFQFCRFLNLIDVKYVGASIKP